MPTEDSFEAHVEQVEDYILRLGDSIEHQDSATFEEDEKEIPYNHFVVKEASYDLYYEVSGRADMEIFLLRYSYDFLSRLEDFLQTDAGEEVFELDEFEAADPHNAALTIINRVSNKDLERLQYNLYEQISNPEVISELYETEDVDIRGFTVCRHLFPKEENWGLSDFYKTLTAVSSTGERGRRFLNNSFAIQIPDDEEDQKTEYSLSFDPEDVFA